MSPDRLPLRLLWPPRLSPGAARRTRRARSPPRGAPPLAQRRRPSQAVASPGAQSTRALTSGAPPPMPFLAGPGPWRRRRPAQEFPRRRRRPTAPCPREPRRSRSRRPRRRTRTGRGARRPPTAPAPPPVVRAPRRRARADFAPAARSRPKRSRRSRRPCSAGAARGGTGRSTAPGAGARLLASEGTSMRSPCHALPEVNRRAAADSRIKLRRARRLGVRRPWPRRCSPRRELRRGRARSGPRSFAGRRLRPGPPHRRP